MPEQPESTAPSEMMLTLVKVKRSPYHASSAIVEEHVEVNECLRCGSVVFNPSSHTHWHRLLEADIAGSAGSYRRLIGG